MLTDNPGARVLVSMWRKPCYWRARRQWWVLVEERRQGSGSFPGGWVRRAVCMGQWAQVHP
jgi:hypothetical protein